MSELQAPGEATDDTDLGTEHREGRALVAEDVRPAAHFQVRAEWGSAGLPGGVVPEAPPTASPPIICHGPAHSPAPSPPRPQPRLQSPQLRPWATPTSPPLILRPGALPVSPLL